MHMHECVCAMAPVLCVCVLTGNQSNRKWQGNMSV